MSRLSHTVKFAITGRSALAAVAHDLAGDGASLTLSRIGDPTGDAEDDVSLERAEEIITRDPALLFLVGEVEFWAAEGARWQMWARCGALQILLQDDPPKGPYGLVSNMVVEAAPEPPKGAEQLAPVTLGPDIRKISRLIAELLASHLRTVLDKAGLP
jgi:hypothetical protein